MIRLLQEGDESAVRAICFQTALYGHPMRPYLDDEYFVGELFAGYYLRHARELFWVAEDAPGRMAGYLAGCLDTRRQERTYARHYLPYLAGLFLKRKLWKKRAAWQLLWAGLRAAPARRLLAPWFDAYPAHLHINLAPAARGQGLGRRLLEHFLAQLQARGVFKLHITTASDAAPAFFHRCGFVEQARVTLPPLFDLPARPWLLLVWEAEKHENQKTPMDESA